jgi:hypothetical protein
MRRHYPYVDRDDTLGDVILFAGPIHGIGRSLMVPEAGVEPA